MCVFYIDINNRTLIRFQYFRCLTVRRRPTRYYVILRLDVLQNQKGFPIAPVSRRKTICCPTRFLARILPIRRPPTRAQHSQRVIIRHELRTVSYSVSDFHQSLSDSNKKTKHVQGVSSVVYTEKYNPILITDNQIQFFFFLTRRT